MWVPIGQNVIINPPDVKAELTEVRTREDEGGNTDANNPPVTKKKKGVTILGKKFTILWKKN